jgi:hypothetical protein
VRVVYSDETGTDGNEQRNPSVVVTGLMLNMDSQWKPVRDEVECAIAETMHPSNLRRYAIHGKSLYHKIERDDAQAKDLMARLMRIPHRCLIPVFYAAVHRAGFRFQMKEFRQHSALADQYRPFRLAFQNCMQEVDNYIHTSYRSEEVLWIHDAGSLDGITKQSLRAWRDFLDEAAEDIRIMKEARQIPPRIQEHVSHVADMIYFGNDEESRALQLVDSCACTIARHLRGDPIASPYYEILKEQIVGEGERPSYENAEKILTFVRARVPQRKRKP